MTTTLDPLVVTVAEAAAALKVSTWYVRKLIREGRIRRVEHMARVVIAKGELERFVNEGLA